MSKISGRINEAVKDFRCGLPLIAMMEKYNCSRQALWKAMRKHNEKPRRSISLDCRKCKHCGTMFQSQQKKKQKYCSRACYMSDRYKFSIGRNEGHKTSRAYRKDARNIIEGKVIHHINGDVSDNRQENLLVFDSQSEHLAFHHSIRING